MRFKRIIFLILVVTGGVTFFNYYNDTFADTATDLASKISNQNKAISDLEAEIAKYQKQLTEIGAQKDTLANAVKILNLEAQKLSADILVTEKKINSTNLKLESLGNSIEKTASNIGDLEIAIGKNIREINMNDKDSLTRYFVTNKSLADVWHYNSEQESFRKGLQEKTGQLSTTKNALVKNQTSVEAVKKDLVILRVQLNDQKSIIQKTKNAKASLLTATKNQETSYQKIVAQKQKLKSQMESDLFAYESQLKFVLNPSLLPKSGSSPFSWPVDRVIITQYFGRTMAAARLYVSGSHNGVDFGTPIGTPVRAMAPGVIVGSGNTDIACPGASYGNWVFVRYDNGLSSVYGHLSLTRAPAGLHVNTGDIVAYSGASGYATGPHLHVSVFPNNGVSINSFPSKACPGRTITIPTAAVNAYLDPMLYLPKK